MSSQYNVSGVWRNGAGNYTIYFASPLPNTGYTVNGNTLTYSTANFTGGTVSIYGNRATGPVNKTVNSVQVLTVNANSTVGEDYSEVAVTIH
jgi:hypothetical protein